MGSYTNPQNFYLIDEDELVNVDNDLNYNLQRADDRVRPLVEYVITAEPSISASTLPKDTGFKWYKSYTNAIWNYRDGAVWQDTNSQVDSWSTSGLTFETGYDSANQEESRIAYSIFNGFVRWRGRLVLTSGGELPANTVVDFMTPPDAALPSKSRYFFVHGGNAASSSFQTFRIFIPAVGNADKRMEYIKYGGSSSSSDQRYISLNDLYYPIDDVP
jgi:hypothetical protein